METALYGLAAAGLLFGLVVALIAAQGKNAALARPHPLHCVGRWALALLALGMRRGSAALRWASLALILVTVGKVFLHDLGHLEDLYRVASLVGLALSLIGISVAYQRLVFRKTPPPGG